MNIDRMSFLIAVLLTLPLVVRAADPYLQLQGETGIGHGQHIVFVAGEEYYRSEEGMCMFAQILAQVLSGLNPSDGPVEDARKEIRMPLAWFKTYTAPSGKQGKSFTTTAGASLDWKSEDLRRLMVNAMLSLTGHDSEISKKTNVDFVEPYDPQPTGARTDEQWLEAKLRPQYWLPSSH